MFQTTNHMQWISRARSHGPMAPESWKSKVEPEAVPAKVPLCSSEAAPSFLLKMDHSAALV